jgi:Flp pilus assembly protein TadD
MLGLVYLKTARPAQAVVEARRAVDLRPSEPGFHLALGTILEETGDLSGAREAIRQEIALRPDHEPSKQKLKEVEARLAQAAQPK